MKDQPLIDMGNHPCIEATGMGDCYLLPGGRVRFIMFDWFRIEGVWRRLITGQLTRPLVGLQEDQAISWQEISGTAATAIEHRVQH